MKGIDRSRTPYSLGPNHPSSVTLSRREMVSFLGSGVLFSGLAACSRQTAREAPPAQLQDELYYSSTVALAHAIRTKQVSSEEVVQACLDRIEEVNPKLNAVVQLVVEDALSKAREADAGVVRGEFMGPLHGVPMTIKDSLDTAGVISTGGTKGRATFIPETDATVVSRLKNAGAILIGKTNTPELTLSFETDNLVYGRTSNPYDVTRTSGGSSGGAAAIVAAGGAPFDIGSDRLGSVRLPAHFCGVAGIKPSAGRVPRTGHIYPFGGMLDSFQQIGPLARYVDDLALLLPIIAGPDWIDPAIIPMPLGSPKDVDLAKLRVSFHTDNGVKTPTAQTVEVIRAAAKALSDENILVEEARPDGIEESMELFSLSRADGGIAVRRLLKEAGTTEHTLHGDTERS
ncbi:MAG: amidase, partial [Candidatus Binatia bacterium]